jgi:hypothetical protein
MIPTQRADALPSSAQKDQVDERFEVPAIELPYHPQGDVRCIGVNRPGVRAPIGALKRLIYFESVTSG